MAITLDTQILFSVCQELMDGHVTYSLGSKSDVNTETSKIKQIDCSGFVQYVIYHASNKQINFHGGSVWQRERCDNLKLEKTEYSTCSENDGWLRIGFIKKNKNLPVGHVWLIHNKLTLESHAGVGPDRRDWDTAKLINNVYACYKLSQIFTQNGEATWVNFE